MCGCVFDKIGNGKACWTARTSFRSEVGSNQWDKHPVKLYTINSVKVFLGNRKNIIFAKLNYDDLTLTHDIKDPLKTSLI